MYLEILEQEEKFPLRFFEVTRQEEENDWRFQQL